MLPVVASSATTVSYHTRDFRIDWSVYHPLPSIDGSLIWFRATTSNKECLHILISDKG